MLLDIYNKYKQYTRIYYLFILFSHLADAFIQSKLYIMQTKTFILYVINHD